MRHVSRSASESPHPGRLGRRQLLGGSLTLGLGATALGGLALTDSRMAVADTGSDWDFTGPEVFDALEDHLDGEPGLDTNNQQGVLGWQVSYLMQAYVQMYLAHRDLDYLERFITRADAMLGNRDSELEIIDDDGLSQPGWSRHQFPELGGGPLHLPVETGTITRPMAWFARIVQTTPELLAIDRYRNKAEVYEQACVDAVAIHDHQWTDMADGTGIYFFPKGLTYAWDGIQCAFNMNHTLGTTLLNLAATTGNTAYRDKAVRMARLLKADLNSGDNEAYVWSYQWSGSWGYTGWEESDDVSENLPSYEGNPRVEDVSHGALSMEFVNQAFWEGIVFTGNDMQRFARTFDNAVVQTDYGLDLAQFIDGTGELEARWHAHAGTWSCLGRFNETIVPTAQTIYDYYAFTQGVGRTTTMMSGVSHLNRTTAGGRPRPGGPFPPRGAS